MYLKIRTFRLLLLAFTCCCFMAKTNAYCSLEKMKKFAMEACEHLFLHDEATRDKRSVAYDVDNLINHVDYVKYNDRKHLISRSVYPRGGYLKVGHAEFQKLSEANVFPKYKPKKLHHDKKARFKRDHNLSFNNIPYCCYNKCEEDFFC